MKKIKQWLKYITSGKLLYVTIIGVLLVIVGGFSLITNYSNFKELNDERSSLGINRYEDNNVLVRDKTLENMKKDIDGRLKEFFQKYIELLNPSKENIQKIEAIYNDVKIKNAEKKEQITKIVKGDFIEALKTKEKEVDSLLISEEIKYSASEKKLIDEAKKKFNMLKKDKDQSLKMLVKNYTETLKIKNDINSVKKSAEKRIAKEKKAAAKKAEQEEKAKEEEEKNSQNQKTGSGGYSSPKPQVEGNYDRASASALAAAINNYRQSLGLSPYAINASQQSCTDREAKAYADTQNPHNWVCKAANNENASYTGIGTDMVGVTMNFFVNDPPHEAPMSGNYSSIAVSVYQSNGMNYTIVDFFN